jgi:PhnB protein
MEVKNYLLFPKGNCREAMETYAKHLGGELRLSKFGEAPMCDKMPDDVKNMIMHSRITKDGEILLMASDCPPDQQVQIGDNYFVCLSVESNEEVDRLFNALSEGGTVKMPAQETFWAHRFGMVKDRFGVNWMLNHEKPMA